MRRGGLRWSITAVLLVAACGGPGDSAGSSPTGPAGSTPPSVSDPVRTCTHIGCQSGVFYRIDASVSESWPRPLLLEICVDDRCETSEITTGQMVASHRTSVGLYDAIDVEAEHTASIRVTGPDGEVLLDRDDTVVLSSSQPNGPGCPPTCWSATVEVHSTE